MWTAIVLAAGKGTRMNSKHPKVLHEVCGLPMAAHVVQAARDAGVSDVVVVVGHEAGRVRKALGPDVAYAEQVEQRGTGHAVLQAERAAAGARHVLVLNGDLPLIRPESLRRLMAHHEQRRAAMTFLTARLSEADGLGRIVREPAGGRAVGIVEWAQATEAQRRQTEINVGAYCFEASRLWPSLAGLPPSKSGEVYLTDMVERTHAAGLPVETLEAADPAEAVGVDTRARLAQAEAVMRQRIRERVMLDGVTLIDPTTTLIDARVQIGRDTVIQPQTAIRGATRIGEDCVIGPWTVVEGSTIGDSCRILSSVIEQSTLEDHVEIGPFSHLRPGAYIERDVHIGNYVEIKNSRLRTGAKSGHFSYIGDADIGRNVNVGAGSITCNFDGVNKLPTTIEDDVFLGCDTMLVAPVRVGTRSKTGAGSVVNRDVQPDTLVVGVPARPIRRTSPKAPAGDETVPAGEGSQPSAEGPAS